MNLNLTLIGQMITFALFVIFTMKFVWPPIVRNMDERAKRMAEGLADADRAKHQLELAQSKSAEILKEAKLKASHIIEDANKRSLQLIEEAKEKAHQEGQRIIKGAEAQLEQQVLQAREQLRKDTVRLAVLGAEKVLAKSVDQSAHEAMLDKLVETL